MKGWNREKEKWERKRGLVWVENVTTKCVRLDSLILFLKEEDEIRKRKGKRKKERRQEVFLLSKCSFHSLLLLLITTRSRPFLNSPSFTFPMRWLNECFRRFFLPVSLSFPFFLSLSDKEKDPKCFVSKEYNWASIEVWIIFSSVPSFQVLFFNRKLLLLLCPNVRTFLPIVHYDTFVLPLSIPVFDHPLLLILL